MKSATITRGPSTDQGTFGTLVTGDGALEFNTIELPDRDNATGKSSLNPKDGGEFVAEWHKSPTKGWCYRLTGTAPRTEILIHVGNFAGDKDKGYVADFLGCIGLGKSKGILKPDAKKYGEHAPQKAILTSAMACQQFNDWGNQEPILIKITRSKGEM